MGIQNLLGVHFLCYECKKWGNCENNNTKEEKSRKKFVSSRAIFRVLIPLGINDFSKNIKNK